MGTVKIRTLYLFNLNIGCIWIWEVADLKKAGLKFNLNIGCIWIGAMTQKNLAEIGFNLNIGCIWIGGGGRVARVP